MRGIVLTILFAAGPAFAAEPFTPAPVPGRVPLANDVTPAARAGDLSGAEKSAPLSGLPTGTVTTGGATTSTTTGDVRTPSVGR